jgi:uncharacterized phage protein (TIGR02218 family)
MKTISDELLAHLALDTTTMTTCWRVVRTDGAVFTFSSFSEPITFDAEVYEPTSAFSHSAIATSGAMNVDNLEISSVLTSDALNDADLLSGLWDFANVEIFQVNWADLTMGKLVLRSGKLGEVKTGRHNFTAELRGLTQPLQQNIGRVYSATCDANLGDARCGKDLTAFTFTSTVTSVTSQAEFASDGLTQDVGYFDYGHITFTSGLNINRSMEVRSFASGGAVFLQMPMPLEVAVDDAFSIVVGCDKAFATCISRFDNALAFRGFPHIPSTDKLASGQ